MFPAKSSDAAHQAALPPHCPKCGGQMRFDKMYPDVRDPQRDECFYRCDCGEKLSIVLPRE
jgi:hypothetical protein